MVEGRWNVDASSVVGSEQKELIKQKLAHKITSEGDLLVKSQTARTQLGNKGEVVRKMNALVEQALQKKKSRIATKPSKASKEKRIESKKVKSQIKEGRRKVKPDNY
jgi:ribosome-associated protein